MLAELVVFVVEFDDESGSQELLAGHEAHAGRVLHELGVQQECGALVLDPVVRRQVLAFKVSVDRQLVDATSTGGADEVDGRSAAAFGDPRNGLVGDVEMHGTPEFARTGTDTTVA